MLDFGVAKLISGVGSVKATLTRWQALTPEYASPEQISGETITTASDTYALGVVLYELLTGARPRIFETGTPADIFKTLNQTAPVAPSKAVKGESSKQSFDKEQRAAEKIPKSTIENLKLLKGDLDNIVLKALNREPERRYETVEQFSEDILRYLRGRPVKARADTFGYRAEKFVRRNLLAVVAAVLVFLSLAAGIAIANYQAAIARRERERAEQRFNDVRQLANSVLFDFYDAIGETPGSTRVRQMMVESAKVYLDKLARNGEGDADLQRELATAYLKIGDVQGKPNMANAGDTGAAMESYREAIGILEKLVAVEPSNTENRRDLSIAFNNLGRVQVVSSDYAAALETHRKALKMREALLADDAENAEYLRLASDSHRLTGDALGEIIEMTEKNDLLAERLENYRQALAIDNQLLAQNPLSNLERRMVTILHQRIGSTSEEIGKATDDAAYFRTALENQRQALAMWIENEPSDSEGRFPAGEYKYIGSALLNLGDTKGALENFSRARAIFENLTKGDANSAEYRRELAYLQIADAEALSRAGRAPDAIKNYRQALQTFEQLTASDPSRVTDNYRVMTGGYESLAKLLEQRGDKSGAAENYRRAAEFGKKWLEIAPDNTTLKERFISGKS